jgi:DNA-binding beta-propeller fold protein YncE
VRGFTFFLFFLFSSAWAQDRMAVVHKHADSVGIYEPQTGRLLETIKVGSIPHEIALSWDGKLAYVTNYGVRSYTQADSGGNTISILDLNAGQVIGAIELGQFHRPHGIEMAHSGRLYVTTDFPPTLLVIDPQQKKIVREIPVGQKLPHMVAVLRNERKAYTADSGTGTVTVLDLTAGKAVKHLPIGGVPMGLALSKDERRLYAVNRVDNQVLLIDTMKDEVRKRGEVQGHPVRCHLTPDEKYLIVTLIQAGEVAILDAATLQEVKRLRAGTNAEGINIDPAGRYLYISAQGDDKVLKYSLRNWQPVLEIRTAARPDPIVFFQRKK